MRINVIVNGEQRSADAEPRKLLVHFLRDDLRLTGTHVGCDTTQCGACTVLFNGDSVKSCTVLAMQADGAEVQTFIKPILEAPKEIVDIAGKAMGG